MVTFLVSTTVCNGEGHSITCLCSHRGETMSPTHSQPGTRRRRVVSTMLRLLYLRERPATHCKEGWVGLGAGHEDTEKLAFTVLRFPHRPARTNWATPTQFLEIKILKKEQQSNLKIQFYWRTWYSKIEWGPESHTKYLQTQQVFQDSSYRAFLMPRITSMLKLAQQGVSHLCQKILSLSTTQCPIPDPQCCDLRSADLCVDCMEPTKN